MAGALGLDDCSRCQAVARGPDDRPGARPRPGSAAVASMTTPGPGATYLMKLPESFPKRPRPSFFAKSPPEAVVVGPRVVQALVGSDDLLQNSQCPVEFDLKSSGRIFEAAIFDRDSCRTPGSTKFHPHFVLSLSQILVESRLPYPN